MASALGAQNLKITVNKKGKVGFSDANGNEIIKCQYESATPFENGVAIVTKSKKSGMVDEKGNVIIPLKYSKITKWSDNLYLVTNGKKQGLVNNDGKILLKPTYTQISNPNCYGRALIAVGGKATTADKKMYMLGAKYGIIDVEGNILVPAKYKGLYEFAAPIEPNPTRVGALMVADKHFTTDTLISDCSYLGYNTKPTIGMAGLMDGRGNVIIKNNKYTVIKMPQSNMVSFHTMKKKDALNGYYNIEMGTEFFVGKTANTVAGDFAGDIAVITTIENNVATYSFVDRNGRTVRSGYSVAVYNPCTKLWSALNNQKAWDVFDEKNSDIAPLSGFGVIIFPKGKDDIEVFTVARDGKFGCVDRNGNVTVPFEYDGATGNTFGVIGVCKGGRWGAVSPENKQIIPLEYANFWMPEEHGTVHFWVKKDDQLYYHLNTLSGKLSAVGYPSVTNFHGDMAFVIPGNLKIKNSALNRALLFEPNTEKATIDAAKPEASKMNFGYVVDTDDNVVMDIPVSMRYLDKITDELRKLGAKKLTSADKKRILLNVTRDNRTYDLKSVLDEDEWDY